MRHLFTLSLSLLTTGSAFAQQLTPKQEAAKARYEHLVGQLRTTLSGSQKTTALTQRLVGQSLYLEQTGNAPSLRDTTRLSYSGTRGSKFDYEQLLFDTYYAPAEGPDFSTEGNPNRLANAADTLRTWQRDPNAPGTTLILQEEHLAGYNSNNTVNTYLSRLTKNTPLDEGARYLHTYNAQGKLTMVTGLSLTNSQWDSSAKKFIFYNAQGRISRDSILLFENGAWKPYMVGNYTYDNAGNLTKLAQQSWSGSGWDPDARSTMTYNNNKQLTCALLELPMGSATWSPLMKDTFAYAGASTYSTLRQRYMFDMFATQAWVPIFSYTRHMNALGLPDTSYMDQWDGNTQQWAHFSKSVLTYNSFSNPVWQKTYSYVNGVLDATSADVYHYYYESFNAPSGIARTEIKADVKVYPNPATDHLNISWAASQQSAVSIRLLNLSGQLLHHEDLSGQHSSTQIGMGHLPAGTYLLQLSNAAGQLLYAGTVVRQ